MNLHELVAWSLLIKFSVLSDLYPVSAVAFYGCMSHNSAYNLVRHDSIVYDTVLTNTGNGYNIGDETFIAPTTGVYAIHFSVISVISAKLSRSIAMGKIGSIFEEGSDYGKGYHCRSTLVVSYVDVDDHIFIKSQETPRGSIFS